MIFVTVGLHNQGFDRLVREMDELAGQIKEEVIIQRGASAYLPRNARFFDYCSREESEQLFQKARLVVCQAGIGSIITALKYEKAFVVVPRLKKYKEHNSDHQLEVAREVGKRYGVPFTLEVKEIKGLLDSVKPVSKDNTGKGKIIQVVKEFIEEGVDE
ncbi:glycosyltransferase [Candidatus Altiarchaeota archaeon]